MTSVITTALNLFLMLFSASLNSISRFYVSCHPIWYLADKADRTSYLDKTLFSPATTYVYVRVDSHCSPMKPVYQGPYKVLTKFSKYFKLDTRHGINNVSIDRIKTAQSLQQPEVESCVPPPEKLRDYCV